MRTPPFRPRSPFADAAREYRDQHPIAPPFNGNGADIDIFDDAPSPIEAEPEHIRRDQEAIGVAVPARNGNGAAPTRVATPEPEAADAPIPLFPAIPKAERFPIEALGSALSRAAAAISRKVQVPEAIAAQSVLAASALAAQAHADVMLPYGQTRPLSLFFATVSASGDRKSSADNEACWPVTTREKALREIHKLELKEWKIASAAWAAEKRKIESDKTIDIAQRRERLAGIGGEPDKPLAPFLTTGDLTLEGLVKNWNAAHPALGIFTSEGGTFTGGHGMSEESRLRTAAALSECWDGRPVKRIRALDGVSILAGRRLSMHLMIQPDASAGFLANPVLRDQGLLSRVLVAAPESIAGTRFYREASPEDNAAIRAYGARILSILEAPWPLADGRNELAPRALTMTPEAVDGWLAFYNHVERQCGSGNDLQPVQDFAAKIAEHAARIAGVLTIVDDHRATSIGVETMRSALTLADWYVNEAVRLQRAARTDPRLVRAQQLLDWLRSSDQDVIGFREIGKLAPSPFRTKAGADEAIGILKSHGWLDETSARPRKFRLIREA